MHAQTSQKQNVSDAVLSVASDNFNSQVKLKLLPNFSFNTTSSNKNCNFVNTVNVWYCIPCLDDITLLFFCILALFLLQHVYTKIIQKLHTLNSTGQPLAVTHFGNWLHFHM